METWSTLEQDLVRKAQEVPNIDTLCEHLHENQKSQEKQLSGLRSFARRVEQFLTQMKAGAVAPREFHEVPARRGETSEPLGYVLGASASSSAVSASLIQTPTPPTVPAPPIPTEASLQSKENASLPPSRDSPTRFSSLSCHQD